jgi:hypothetical protein
MDYKLKTVLVNKSRLVKEHYNKKANIEVVVLELDNFRIELLYHINHKKHDVVIYRLEHSHASFVEHRTYSEMDISSRLNVISFITDHCGDDITFDKEDFDLIKN